jgi:pSer/pThr/pTyr-binding forkhead associated (FHA) protein
MHKFLLQFEGAVLKEIPIEKDELTVGRKPDNDIVIDNPVVSGHHCRIVRQGETFSVEDLNSSNGVFVNAKKIAKVGLKHNDIIDIAKHALRFIDERQAQSPTASAASADATLTILPERQQEMASAATSAAQKRPAVVRIVKGLVDRPEYELRAPSTYIGKSDRVQIRIKGKGFFGSAPENAAMIANRQEGYFIVPIEEGYTKLNDRTILQKELLKDGDVIIVGGSTMRFEDKDSE